MINVSRQTKQAFMSDVSKKTFRVVFPELNLSFDNSSIEVDSFKLTEAISNKDSVEYVGCISSTMDINIHGLDADVKNKRIQVYIRADNTDEIPLFNGIVDSAVIDASGFIKDIVAYDDLYTKGSTDVVAWYNQQFPNNDSTKTVKQLRDSLFQFIGLEQVSISLPNDNVVITKQYNPKSLQCVAVMKAICQMNGCCGIINRYGKFDYRYVLPVYEGIFPSVSIFPSSTLFPQKPNVAHTFQFHETLKFEEYYVKPMVRVQIRDNEDDSGTTVGADTGNKYILQSNMFTYGMLPSVQRVVAQNILNKLKNVKFHPFDSKNYGIPYVEVGDGIKYVLPSSRTGIYATNSFTVLSRTLSGVQLLRDSYNARGNETQSEFITDLKTTLDTLKLNESTGGGGELSDYYTKEEVQDYVSDYAYDKEETMEAVSEEVATQVSDMETPTGFTVVSCYTLPSNRAANTIYLVQSDLVVVR